MPARPYLELHLHLANGRTHKWVQNDKDLAAKIIAQITPKIFAQPSLILHDESSGTAYPSTALLKLDILMEEIPDDLLQLIGSPTVHSTGLWEITEDEYAAKRHLVQPIIEGEPFFTLMEIEVSNGQRLYVEIHVGKAVSAMQERQILHQFFERPTSIFRRLDGGISLWNRAHFLSVSFCPMPTVPINSWPAKRADHN